MACKQLFDLSIFDFLLASSLQFQVCPCAKPFARVNDIGIRGGRMAAKSELGRPSTWQTCRGV
eukprot:1844872-Amphidinium_carterae.1